MLLFSQFILYLHRSFLYNFRPCFVLMLLYLCISCTLMLFFYFSFQIYLYFSLSYLSFSTSYLLLSLIYFMCYLLCHILSSFYCFFLLPSFLRFQLFSFSICFTFILSTSLFSYFSSETKMKSNYILCSYFIVIFFLLHLHVSICSFLSFVWYFIFSSRSSLSLFFFHLILYLHHLFFAILYPHFTGSFSILYFHVSISTLVSFASHFTFQLLSFSSHVSFAPSPFAFSIHIIRSCVTLCSVLILIFLSFSSIFMFHLIKSSLFISLSALFFHLSHILSFFFCNNYICSFPPHSFISCVLPLFRYIPYHIF